MLREEVKKVNQNMKAVVAIYKETREGTPEETVAAIIEKLGYSEAIETIAAIVRTVGDWDGRVYDYVRAWAAENFAYDQKDLMDAYIFQPSEIHPAHINQIGQAAMKAEAPTPADFEEVVEAAVVEEISAEKEGISIMTQTVLKSNSASFAVNEEHNGLEITFAAKPTRETLDALKASGFRWHNARKLWYAKNTPERLAMVCEICHGDTPTEPKKGEKKPERHPAVNKYGVKVGDLFWSSWGYDQTNNDFFQVVALVGESSVRVREVYPEITDSKAVSWASEDRTIRKPSELLPPAPHSVFINDQEKGDLKRLKSYAKDGISDPQFNLSSFANAYLMKGDKMTVYESWYA